MALPLRKAPPSRNLGLPPREVTRGKPIRWRIRPVHGDEPGQLLTRVYEDVEDARADAAAMPEWTDFSGRVVRYVVETD